METDLTNVFSTSRDGQEVGLPGRMFIGNKHNEGPQATTNLNVQSTHYNYLIGISNWAYCICFFGSVGYKYTKAILPSIHHLVWFGNTIIVIKYTIKHHNLGA